MAGITEEKLRDDCKAAFEEIFAIIEKIQSNFACWQVHPAVKIAEHESLRGHPRRALLHIGAAFATWDGSLKTGEKDKTGLSTALLAARLAVSAWVVFCNQRMEG